MNADRCCLQIPCVHAESDDGSTHGERIEIATGVLRRKAGLPVVSRAHVAVTRINLRGIRKSSCERQLPPVQKRQLI